jgi:purine-cytosine permease-like protein
MTDKDDTASTHHHHHAIHIFGRRFRMPRSRALRVLIGVLLIILGILGFLPVLGFWMIPLGLLVLSYEFHLVRRLRRRTLVWWERRQRARARK